MTAPNGARSPRLDGRVALVSGAARGQGRSHCLHLARAGADVIGFDVCAPVTDDAWYPPSTEADLAETGRLVRETGRRAVLTVADVRDAAAVTALVEDGLAELGRLDIVVANAGIVTPSPAVDLTDEAWRTVIDVDLTGAWNTIRPALPHLLARGAGSVVVISSANGGIKAPPHLAHYAAAKHGLVGMVRSLAAELGPQGVRVNSVHPTAVATPLIHNEQTYRLFAPDAAAPTAQDVAPVFAAFHSLPVPWIEPEDVSRAVVWLAGDTARYVTGVALPVDAGLSAR